MEEFYSKFEIIENSLSDIKIIIGLKPYKQKLNNISFAVNITSSDVSIYQNIGNIAFFVNNWIKVQDSLEMVFNLLFGYRQSIFALAELKRMSISPLTFAESLWKKANIVFVNRFLKNGSDQKENILDFIKENSNKSKFILFAGHKSYKNFGLLPDNTFKAISMHPSGANLNFENRQQEYTNCWYLCNDTTCYEKDDQFDLNKFKIFIRKN